MNVLFPAFREVRSVLWNGAQNSCLINSNLVCLYTDKKIESSANWKSQLIFRLKTR